MSKLVAETEGWLLYGPYKLDESRGRARWMIRPPERYGTQEMLFFTSYRQVSEFLMNIKRNAKSPQRNLERAYERARRVPRRTHASR